MTRSVSFRACLTDGGALDDEVPAAADGVGLQEAADPQVAPQRHRRALVTARHRAHEEHTETWGERADEGTQWTEDAVYGSQSTRRLKCYKTIGHIKEKYHDMQTLLSLVLVNENTVMNGHKLQTTICLLQYPSASHLGPHPSSLLTAQR